jgi:thiamine pyrophosphokinase
MTPDFVPFRENVTLLGGGELSRDTVTDMLKLAPNLVATDGAARHALEMGLELKRVVGDMDSLDPATRAALPPEIIDEIPEQDSTDFDKALRTVHAPLILGVGFMGARLDHELACYNSLVRHPRQKCILVGEHDICFHLPETLALALPPGSRLSLFPMAGMVVDAEGLKYPVAGMRMSPWGLIGTSNEVTEGPVKVRADRPGLLVILPRALLGAAIRALVAGA